MMAAHENTMEDREGSMIYHEKDLNMRRHGPVSAKLLRTASTRSTRSRTDNLQETTRGALLGDSPAKKNETVVPIKQEDDASIASESTAEVGIGGDKY